MKRVCIINNKNYPIEYADISDGGGLNVYVLTQELINKGFQVDVFTRNENNFEEVIEKTNLKIVKIPYTRYKSDDVFTRDFNEGKSFGDNLIKSNYFEVENYHRIHTHHWASGISILDSLTENTILLHTSHLLACEKAYYNGLQLPEDVRNAEQKLLNRANFIFALSENEKDVIISNYGIQKNKIVLAANGIKDTFYKIPELNPVPDQRLEILFIGRSCKQKGIDVLLNAYELFLTKNGNSFLCLAGGNYSEFDVDREVDEKIDKAPIAGKAIHLGRITHDIVVDLMSKCFVYVQPSRYESQGIAILEAMASGRVVVASDLPAVSEYIKNGVNGILINSGDHTQLANVLQDISQSPNKFLEMSKKARETAKQFTWERMLNIILELY